jgi:death-on-curing protein
VDTLSKWFVLFLHDECIEWTGGAPGVLNEGQLEAAIQRPLSGTGDVELFPSAFEKAAALAHGIATSHPFVDGNKRTAFLAASALLALNGFALEVSATDGEETMVALALGELTLAQFAEWLRAHTCPAPEP